MIKIEKVEPNENIVNKLIDFSIQWEKENSCFGYRTNTVDDFKNQDIYLAYDDEEVVGYLFGFTNITKNESVTIPISSKIFEVEEIFVKEDYRGKGIGQQLFRFLEKSLDSSYDYICLSTATKNYKKILHFYIDELDMTFWSARLFKNIKIKE